jgi:ABC-type nitrate/sulfonate/bicarbonate transport system permease component
VAVAAQRARVPHRRFVHSTGFLYARSLLALVVLWQLITMAIGNHVILPQPWTVAVDLWKLLLGGEVFSNAAISVARLVVSFLLAGAIAIPLGLLMGLSPLANDLIDPVVELLRPISGIAWIPLALFIFGVGNELPIFIITYVAVFPFLLNTIAGVRTADRTLIRAARTMGLSQGAIIRQVVVPGALPHILTGARIAGGAVWMALVAAELIGAPSGLGFAIEWYRQLLMTPKVIAFILVISVLGYLTDRTLRWLQQRLTPWAAGIGAAQ